MAAIGQGDARWIVTDLGEEGQNVGQYHWEEKFAFFFFSNFKNISNSKH